MAKAELAHGLVGFTDPPVAQWLLGDTHQAWLWLLLRLYLGYTWLEAGWGKLNNPKWLATGEALKGFWERAIQTDPRPVITFGWYRDFIEGLLTGGHYVWFAKLILFGELAVGLVLILGAFTGIAAFWGGIMNWNFMMAGTASSNPLLFAISIGLILAWKIAGWYGLDRWVLPALGTPWQPGRLFRPGTAPGAADSS